jgi:hypothetical protein
LIIGKTNLIIFNMLWKKKKFKLWIAYQSHWKLAPLNVRWHKWWWEIFVLFFKFAMSIYNFTRLVPSKTHKCLKIWEHIPQEAKLLFSWYILVCFTSISVSYFDWHNLFLQCKSIIFCFKLKFFFIFLDYFGIKIKKHYFDVFPSKIHFKKQ